MKPGIKKYTRKESKVKLKKQVKRLATALSIEKNKLHIAEDALYWSKLLNEALDDKCKKLESDNNLLKQMLDKKPNILKKVKHLIGSK